MNNVGSIKEMILHNMPTRPVKRSEFIEIYGKLSDNAVKELVSEGKLIRVKRGYYSLSDELLDEYQYKEEEESNEGDKPLTHTQRKPLLPTEELNIILSSFISNYTTKYIVETLTYKVFEELNYYTTTKTGTIDGGYEEHYQELLYNLSNYQLTTKGEYLLGLLNHKG